MEPKGSHLQLEDRWKEDFLLSLNQNNRIEVLSENEDVRLLGVKFNSNDKVQKTAFRNDLKDKLLQFPTHLVKEGFLHIIKTLMAKHTSKHFTFLDLFLLDA